MDDPVFDSIPMSVDGHIHFAASWDGVRHHVFVSAVLIGNDAGQFMTRGQMCVYLTENAGRFVALAKRQQRRADPGATSITLDASNDFGREKLINQTI